jgi:hypothetical protein
MIRHLFLILVISALSNPAASGTSKTTNAVSRPAQPDRHGQNDDKADRASGDLALTAETGRVGGDPSDPRYQKPCGKAEDKPYSDLCAQWTAANAAEKSAFWAVWGVFASAAGLIGLLISLFLTMRATNLAARATLLAGKATRDTARSLAESKKANGVAADALDAMLTEFRESMRPRCVVVGITLVEKWYEFIEAGTDLPFTLKVENLGGGTGRHLSVQIDEISFLDKAGKIVFSEFRSLHMAPLRAGQMRPEPMLLKHTAFGQKVYGVRVKGHITSIGDLIDGLTGDLRMTEVFVWSENPLYRSSADLVERAP